MADLQRARNLVQILMEAEPLDGSSVEIAVGIPQMSESRWRAHEQYILADAPRAVARHLRWERVEADNARRMFASHDLKVDLTGIEIVLIPRDWGWNFTDCDVWINIADLDLGPVYPLRPVAHYCGDLAVRIAPFAFAGSIADPYWIKEQNALRLWRQGAVVITGDPYTVDDIIGYAGVRRQAIMTVPGLLEFGGGSLEGPNRDRNQLVWWMEPNQLFAFAEATEGLRLYLAEGGGLSPVIATEADLAIFDPSTPHPWVAALPVELRTFLAACPKERVQTPEGLERILSRSGALWSSRVAGGEGYGLQLAARANLHFLGQDFPLQRDMAEKLGSSVQFYDELSASKIADALHQLERMCQVEPAPTIGDADLQSYVMEYGFVLDRLAEVRRV
jgi:hypothetical protein